VRRWFSLDTLLLGSVWHGTTSLAPAPLDASPFIYRSVLVLLFT
jgi:hypothetical protein